MRNLSRVERDAIEHYAPYLCGECDVCRAAGCAEQRTDEYLANLEPGETASVEAALLWLRVAYPECPLGCVVTSVIREMFVNAAEECPSVYTVYSKPWRGHPAVLELCGHHSP